MISQNISVLALALLGFSFGCGVNTVRGGGSQGDTKADGGTTETCDKDADGFLCANDCNDSNAAIFPGAAEIENGLDDNCDGKIDNGIAGKDFDGDGIAHPEDCDDDNALISPEAIEVGGDSVDNNCNGTVDEALNCVSTGDGSATDFAKALGLCSNVLSASFPSGNVQSRITRSTFGTSWVPLQGSDMVMLSTGRAKDTVEEPTYRPQEGQDFGTDQTHPLYTAPRCAVPSQTPLARDVSELKLTLKVPANALSLSFQFNFFSAEYPEYVCQKFNDRFIAIVESSALDVTKLPQGQCKNGTTKATCNVSYDKTGEPVTVNNSFFDHCVSASGQGWNNVCTQGTSMLAKTGYDNIDEDGRVIGGATGWLTTKIPVKPNEEMTIQLLVLDEGDGIYDSAVLLDNFKWEATSVEAPVTIN